MEAFPEEQIMRTLTLSLAFCCALAASGSAAAAQHGPDHATTSATDVQSAPATRWPADAALREGMRDIRLAVVALEHYEHGHMGPAQATVLAQRIEGDVRDILATCKLAPEADAALHVILARLLREAGALKADPTDVRAIEPMRDALASYARQFDDPESGATGD